MGLLALLGIAVMAPVCKHTMSEIAIIPQPNSLQIKGDGFTLTSDTKIVADGRSASVANFAATELRSATGYPLEVAKSGRGATIEFRIDERLGGLGSEGYQLKTAKNKVTITAKAQAGLFYGYQTLKQLLPSDAYRRAPIPGTLWTTPGVEIVDVPRFKWRGAHIDVARHFQPKEFLFKFIDLLAMHKLNTMHLHLTEDQGWRMEIKRYPKLTSVGAWRKDTMLTYDPPTYTGKPHGGFYTQEDLRELVAYAKERHITIVPEIEMPGHAQAAIAAYPELGNGNGQLEVWTKWGVSENVFNVKDSTIKFLQDVLVEVMDVFPSEFIHIGGDECPKVQWKNSADAQERMKSLGLKDEHELQSWFIRQMDQFLDAKGRRLIGWSEILEGGLAPGAALMVWLGDDGAMTAVSSGHDVVMAQTSHLYFDYYQSQDRKNEPHAIGGFVPLNKVYAYDPVLPKMTPEQAKHVMGAQFQLWSEYIPNPKHMEYMAYPRGCALAEVGWTEVKNKDFANFRSRLAQHTLRLDALDVNYRRLDP